ncbi:hypothetical protein BDF19DRAFT_389700 [Syncephalis fuscata]|nr:hypothetical protein BDF19DRAFT_389700 [Syncephalis fuscata]
MSRNKLRALPDDFGQLMSLKILSVANNRLRHLPRYLGDMKQLRILKLQHNPLNWPPHHVVESTPETDGSVWLDQLKLYLRENTLTNSDVNGDKQGKWI